MCQYVPSGFVWFQSEEEGMARRVKQITPFQLRLPGALHLKLMQLAYANQCSLHSEIIRRLEHSIAVESPLSADAQRVLDLLERRMEQIEFRLEALHKSMEGKRVDLLAPWPRKSMEGEDK
jgi:hypothetical protein